MYSLGKIKDAKTGEEVEVFTDGRGRLMAGTEFTHCYQCGGRVHKDIVLSSQEGAEFCEECYDGLTGREIFPRKTKHPPRDQMWWEPDGKGDIDKNPHTAEWREKHGD